MKKYGNLNIGILALQGDFERHQHQLKLLGNQPLLVKLPQHLENLDALIMPGGESSTMSILIDRFKLRKVIQDFVSKKPIYGTCAGMILLSKKVENNTGNVQPFGFLDIDVLPNGYGRQIFSFEDEIKFNLNGKPGTLKATFIRAPKITRFGEEIEVLAKHDDIPVLVAGKNILAASFHTELDDDTRLIKYFIDRFVTHPA